MKMSFVDRESKHVRGRIVYDMLVGVYGGDGRSNLRLLYKFELDQPMKSHTEMSTNIYILKLQGGKYYVGKSENPMKRYQEHLSGKGSAWTKKYKPISIEKVIEKASHFDEDKYTKEYMSKYGIENVRGGAYVSMELDENQKDSLIREILGATDCCTRCGKKGHFVKNCRVKVVEEDEDEDEDEEEDEDEDEEEDEDEYTCKKCNKEFPDISGRESHEKRCGRKKNSCYRCGHEGHYSPDCYASRHKKGYELDYW